MSAMVIPTARVSGARRGSAVERAREAWFAGAPGTASATVPTPRRSRPAAPPVGASQAQRTAAAATHGPRGSADPMHARRGSADSTDVRRASVDATHARRGSAGVTRPRQDPTSPAHATHPAATAPRPQRASGVASRPQSPSGVRASAADALRRPVPAARRAVQAEERPLRLTRRGRLVVLLLAGLVLAGGIRGGHALADGPSRALEVTTYTVAAGETLWEIAAEQARPGEDVRDVVLELKSLNDLRTAGLAAGQQIVLPARR